MGTGGPQETPVRVDVAITHIYCTCRKGDARTVIWLFTNVPVQDRRRAIGAAVLAGIGEAVDCRGEIITSDSNTIILDLHRLVTNGEVSRINWEDLVASAEASFGVSIERRIDVKHGGTVREHIPQLRASLNRLHMARVAARVPTIP